MLNKEKPVTLIIDKEKCTKCSICLNSCHDYLKTDKDGYPSQNQKSQLGCIQCGHCMMKCPNDAIEIKGEGIDKNHLRELSNDIADYKNLQNLLLKRRSHRKFKKEEISNETIQKILNSASAAAVGLPPSEVKVIVINGYQKMQEFTEDLIEQMQQAKKIFNPLLLNIFKPLISEPQFKMFKEFIIPLLNETLTEREQGKDILLYDAPAIMIFYASEISSTEDPIIAATQATLAAETLGLGTCFIGSVCPILDNKKLRKKYGILKEEKLGTAFILGVPDNTYLKGFQRNFKEIKIIN